MSAGGETIMYVVDGACHLVRLIQILVETLSFQRRCEVTTIKEVFLE